MNHRFLILGEPVVEGLEGRVQISSRKGQALLWYCAAQSERSFSRSSLAAIFWGGARTGLDSLGMALTRLRHELPVWPLRVTRQTIGWDPESAVFLDARCFDGLLEPGRAPEDGNWDNLDEAVRLWRGPFLSDFGLEDNAEFEAWLLEARNRWKGKILEALGRLTRLREGRSDWEGVKASARQAIGIDPLREVFHRSLMQAHFRLGDPAAALSQYDSCRETLRREVGVEPDLTTQALWRFLGLGDSARSTLPADFFSAPRVALVGRGKALRALLGAVGSAEAGAEPVILLSGEAGVGKTRLVEEVARGEVPSDQPRRTILSGHCRAEDQSTPLAPFVEALRSSLPRFPLAWLDLPENWLAELGRLLPEVAAARPDLQPTSGGAEEGWRCLIEALEHLLLALPSPSLLILEDVHWVDNLSLALLGHLARRQDRGLVLLLTVRTGEVPEQVRRLLDRLERERRLVRQEVEPLTPGETRELSEAVLQRALPQPVGQRLHAVTGGVPLFVLELLGSLKEEGSGDDLEQWPVPSTIQAAVEERLDRLTASSRELMDAASVFPEKAPFSFLGRMVDLGEEETVSALESLVRAQFLYEVGAKEVAFSHELVRRVVRDGLSPARRCSLHRRAYSELVGAGAPRTPPESFAYHAEEGGLWEDAFQWNLRSAAGVAGYAQAGSVLFLERALGCLERLSPTPERRQRAVDLRLRLAEVTRLSEVERSEYWLRQTDGSKGPMQPQMRLERSFNLLLQGRLKLAESYLAKIVGLARVSGRQLFLARSLCYAGHLRTISDGMHGLPLLQEAVGLYESLGHRDFYAVLSKATLSTLRTFSGDFAAATVIDELIRRAEEDEDPATLAMALAEAAMAAGMREDWDYAAQVAERGLLVARASRHTTLEYLSGIELGLARARLGDPAGGLTIEQEAIALARETGLGFYLGRAQAWLGEIWLQAGESDAAAVAGESGLKIARRAGWRYEAALNLRLLGRTAAARGRREEARRFLVAAGDILAEMGARPDWARCEAILGEVSDAKSERAEHRRIAEEIINSLGPAISGGGLAPNGGRVSPSHQAKRLLSR